MRALKYKELKSLHDKHGSDFVVKHLSEALGVNNTRQAIAAQEEAPKAALKPEDINLTEIARVLFGHHTVEDIKAGALMSEAVDGVDSTTFANITGQVISAKVMETYQMETALASSLIRTESTRLDNERRPGITRTGDVSQTVHEGMPYETFGFGEEYQDYPAGVKRGHIVAVTREAVFFDRTAMVLQRAGEVGTWLGINKEKRIWDVILGITNNYNWNGNAYNTYYPPGAGAPWSNIHVQPLRNWTNIDLAERLFDGMTDPATGEPVLISGATIIVMPPNFMTAKYILSATETRDIQANQANMIGGNPLSGYTLASKSRLARARLATLVGAGMTNNTADATWLLGDFKKAFVYRENWPIGVRQEPTNAAAEFEQDIVARYRADERGVAAVDNPRFVIISSSGADHSSSDQAVPVPEDWPGSSAYGATGIIT